MSTQVATAQKICADCGYTLDISNFETYLTRTGNLTCRNKCKRCKRYRQHYKLNYRQVKSIQDKQQNQCAICKTTFHTFSQLRVDHCHKTNKVRGILCNRCNLLLGCVHDDISNLLSCIKYLNATNATIGY